MFILQIKLNDVTRDCLSTFLPGFRSRSLNGKGESENGNKTDNSGIKKLANLSAAHSMTQVSKLLAIASDSSYSDEVRALAGSMVNDALSHMKQQSIDSDSANQLGLVLGASSNIEMGSAASDIRTIKENAQNRENSQKGHRNMHWHNRLITTNTPKTLILA